MQNKLALKLIFFLITTSITASAQKQVTSAIARYNLGILEPSGSVRSLGMGGIGTAIRDNSTVYFNNPASYSSLDTNSFIFDFGVNYGLNLLSDGTSKYTSDDMNFDHLMLGFPIAKNFGFVAGVVPYSNGYYRIEESVEEGDPDYDPVTGGYTAYHLGTGNITRFFVGSGISITKNFSLGVNMEILSGSIKRANEFDFDDYYYVYHNNISATRQLSGINFDYGIQYTASLKKDWFFIAGASLSFGQHYKSKLSSISYKFNAYGSVDTISFTSVDSVKAYLPGSLHTGISFGKKNKFTTGIDFNITDWSKAELNSEETHFADTRALRLGAEYIPDYISNYSYLRRVAYRIGAHMEDNYLVFDGNQVKEYGFSLGAGIPLKGISKSTVYVDYISRANFFIDFTRKSLNTSTFEHYENYFTFGISLNLYDLWFLKHRYE